MCCVMFSSCLKNSLWLFAGVITDKYFSFHIFFCLQQLNLKFEVIAQVSPTNIKCNESFISSKFRKEGRLSKVNFRKKQSLSLQ